MLLFENYFVYNDMLYLIFELEIYICEDINVSHMTQCLYIVFQFDNKATLVIMEHPT